MCILKFLINLKSVYSIYVLAAASFIFKLRVLVVVNEGILLSVLIIINLSWVQLSATKSELFNRQRFQLLQPQQQFNFQQMVVDMAWKHLGDLKDQA